MSESWDALSTMAPALLFLCAAVPLAALLDELGFFGAVAAAIERRFDQVPVIALWCLAAATTAVLNLDTTIVLLTPLYVRLARANGADPLGVALVPLLLASFASCVLPVSNLTTLLVVERLDVRPAAVLVHLAPVSLVACTVGWWSYRRRHPEALPGISHAPIDRRAVRIGSFVVAGLLVGFVVGPTLGIEPWFVTLVADVALVLITRRVPGRAGPRLGDSGPDGTDLVAGDGPAASAVRCRHGPPHVEQRVEGVPDHARTAYRASTRFSSVVSCMPGVFQRTRVSPMSSLSAPAGLRRPAMASRKQNRRTRRARSSSS